MANVISVNSVKDTVLWKRLDAGFKNPSDSDLGKLLAANTLTLCKKASDRIKEFPYYHPQYTLHDQTHMLRVCELMALVAGKSLNSLNPVEIFLLICSAHFHDQGMVPDADEWMRIKTSADFKVSLERWELENPNLREIRQQLHDMRFSDDEQQLLRSKEREILEAHRTEFLRRTHGDRSDAIVNRLLGTSDLLNVGGYNLAQLLGRICVSHVWPASQLTDQTGFRVDDAIGIYTVNSRYLALLLRLADILDFDQDRTPDALLRTIHFASTVSAEEWAKHRSVAGWEIGPKRIRFTMQCEHPAYQSAAYTFMDWIDHELVEAHRVVREFPRDTPNHYHLDLPTRVDRERIEPRNSEYRYADLEFTLSREEIVKLLMTDELYQSNALFVRELLQNALDALRYRVAIHGQGRPDWDEGSVTLEHTTDRHGFQVVRCSDNGIGMDEHVISKFLTRVGRSYYRSPEFEQQRIGFREKGVDFDPCSKFGIGFMSCFMFGDRITIHTRRDYGPGRDYGDPLVVEVNGLGGLLVIRDGSPDQEVGTKLEITGPLKPAFLDEWADRVRLCSVVEGYALATEFPIAAKVAIAEIAKEIEVPISPATRPTFEEEHGVEKHFVIEQPFSEVHPALGGCIRAGFLIDDADVPTLKNDEARWAIHEKEKSGREIRLEIGDKSAVYHGFDICSSVCMDGILISGEPGREGRDYLLAKWGSNLHLGDPFVLDIRGNIKPTLTPARRPPERRSGFDRDPSWKRTQRQATAAHALLWEKVTNFLPVAIDHDTYWKLSLLHQAPVHLMRADILWERVSVPVIGTNEEIEWNALRELECVICAAEMLGKDNRETFFTLADGRRIGFGEELSCWYPSGGGHPDWKLKQLVARFSRLCLKDGNTTFAVFPPDVSDDSHDREPGFGSSFDYLHCIPYEGDLHDLVIAQSELGVTNRRHPLVQHVRSYVEVEYAHRDDFQMYCESVVYCLSNRDNLKQIDAGEVHSGRQFRRLGILYKSLNWAKYDDTFKPPYKVWAKQSGVIEITHDTLMQWASFGNHD